MFKPHMVLMLSICCVLLGSCRAPAPTPAQTVDAAQNQPASAVATHAPPTQSAPAITPTLSFATDRPLDEITVTRLLTLALDCVHQEYPNVLLHSLASDADAQTPKQLHPAFYGCYDWHSSVHGHWLLARLAHLYPDSEAAPAAREALFLSLSKDHIAAELKYMRAPGRQAFERPYGLAWLLQLDAELGDWAAADEPLADSLKQNLAPLVQQALQHLQQWLPKLSHPVRSGTHGQTAFALGLMRDWAQAEDNPAVIHFIDVQSQRLFAADQRCPLGYEPSGHDFFSACLAEADLMRRVLPATQYPPWLSAFLPGIPTQSAEHWLLVAQVTDPTDGHLAHLDGLNLSRAWMLEGIASGLTPGDPRFTPLLQAAAQHRRAGMVSIEDPHYAGGHWLGSFATYLVTQRGLSQQ
ncbi:MAG: DUF2891 domain-containing protein [Pseudomonadales bacterium]